ncbi:MAG TPA: circularly permuted type 2 ATP-grasp protein, partial [Prosthecobacter sp.]|nr:circularly permuted type 2 ATP-grasp protein [Prosthecobacter sp.]
MPSANPAARTATPPHEAPAGGGLLEGYRPQPGVHDEMLLPGGALRPHWRTFGSFLAQCGPEDIQARAAAIQRLLRDHGVTYNVYDDALGTSRPWSLDVLPFLLGEDEWLHVSAGLDQRSRLLNAILADLYGPQTLIQAGLLPPRILHANPGFLRPAAGITPPGGRWLSHLACDLVRGADGRWLVLTDRAERPAGHGYTLENRVILSNVFPEEFNASRVRRLAAHFDSQREMLQSLAPKTRHGRAGILMLTPGPRHETYYEHAFLARHLGFPLVEGADLTTRDRALYLKTLEGLHRVDVMVRHVDDRWCDPLELRAESLIGVAGLVEAWRNGSVALANGLGAGIVETPALHPFLPGICRHLLGQELLLPCVPTWWCGQQRELELLLAEPSRWVVKPAFARGARDPVFLADLDSEQRERQLESIRAAPHEWVAQEVLPLSTTPAWTGSRIEARPLVWRAFAIARGEGFETMPGGLARVSPEPGRWLITLRSGGISKDTWVISSGAHPHAPQAPAREAAA